MEQILIKGFDSSLDTESFKYIFLSLRVSVFPQSIVSLVLAIFRMILEGMP